MREQPWKLALSATIALLGAGCTDQTYVQEPWVSGDQFAQERQRTQEQAKALDHRLVYTQNDR